MYLKASLRRVKRSSSLQCLRSGVLVGGRDVVLSEAFEMESTASLYSDRDTMRISVGSSLVTTLSAVEPRFQS
jgi:hypothetical protein